MKMLHRSLLFHPIPRCFHGVLLQRFSEALFLSVVLFLPAQAQHPRDLKYPPLRLQPPRAERHTLSNGIQVFVLEDHELPIFQMELWVRAGWQFEPLEKIGLGGLFEEVMRDGGTPTRPPEALNRELELMPASVETWMAEEAAGIRCSCLARDIPRTLEICADVLLHPAFPEDKVRQRKQEAFEEIRRRNDRANAIAHREFLHLLYGPKHPSGWRSEFETIEPITREDLAAYHRAFFAPEGAVISASGDFRVPEFLARLQELLGGWKGSPAAGPMLPVVQGDTARAVFLVSKDVAQSHIRIGHLGVKRHNPDRFALIVLNEILGGGGFTSRFVREIRSRRGLAYNVYSYFTEGRDRGVLAAAAETKAESTAETIALMLQMIQDLREKPVTEQELATAKESILNSFVFRFDSLGKIVNQRLHLYYYGFPEDYLETYEARMSRVTKEDVLRVARTYLHPDRSVILAVGNPDKFDRPLSEFGPVKRIELRP